jgi:hypothetical protein
MCKILKNKLSDKSSDILEEFAGDGLRYTLKNNF